MALKNNFYEEIFLKEQEWISMINDNLLNSIYCSLVLKPFYVQKKEELIENKDNPIIDQMLFTISNIIAKIDEFDKEYRNFESSNMKSLLPLLLTNQMNNNVDKRKQDINDLKLRRQLLETLIQQHNLENDKHFLM